MTGYTAHYIKVTGAELYYDGQSGFSPNLVDAEAYADEADADTVIGRLAVSNPNISVNKVQKMVPGSDETERDSEGEPVAGEGTLADTATMGDTDNDASGDFPSDSEGDDDPARPSETGEGRVEPHEEGDFPSDSEGGEDDPARGVGGNRDC